MCFELLTLAHVKVNKEPNYDYVAMGYLPEFTLKGWQHLRDKKANIMFRVNADTQTFNHAILYFDYGESYTQESLVLLHAKADGCVRTNCCFPASLQGVRLVPVISGLFSVVDLKIEVEGLTDSDMIHSGTDERVESQPPCALSADNDVSYAKWIALNELPTEKYPLLKKRANEWQFRPLISIVMPTYNTNEDFLIKAIESVRAQTYDHWQLCIADDASTLPHVEAVLDHYSVLDKRINVVYLKQNSHICKATNAAIGCVKGAYIGFLDHDDELHPLALHCVAQVINANKNAAIIYSDEDKILEDGTRLNPYFKCDFNYDLFLSQNMICHFGVYKTSMVKSLGGMREGYDGSQDYDLALRVMDLSGKENIIHIPRVLYHWRLHSESTSVSFEAKLYAQTAAVRAVQAHLDRMGVAAQVEQDAMLPAYQYVRYQMSDNASVDIIVVFNENTEHLTSCITSILKLTEYTNYQVTIIDQSPSDAQGQLEALSALSVQPKVNVVQSEAGLSLAQARNNAALNSQADYICLLHQSIEITTGDWLPEMLTLASRTDIGCVGAKLLTPNDRIAHAGIVVLEHTAHYVSEGTKRTDAGHFSRLGLLTAYRAVSTDCMLVSRDDYLRVGGFDPQLSSQFSDVDFCLQLTKHGHHHVCTPYVHLCLHQPLTKRYNSDAEMKKNTQDDLEVMQGKWKTELEDDPYYSPNLASNCADFSYAWPTRVSDLLSG